jgi:hypothetical protein
MFYLEMTFSLLKRTFRKSRECLIDKAINSLSVPPLKCGSNCNDGTANTSVSLQILIETGGRQCLQSKRKTFFAPHPLEERTNEMTVLAEVIVFLGLD